MLDQEHDRLVEESLVGRARGHVALHLRVQQQRTNLDQRRLKREAFCRLATRLLLALHKPRPDSTPLVTWILAARR